MHGLYLIRPDGTGLRKLAVPIRNKAVSYAWSPDSRELVVGGNKVPNGPDYTGYIEPASPYPLIAVNVDGSSTRRLTQRDRP